MKKFTLLFLIAFSVIIQGTSQSLTDSLLLYYPMNNNANDASGRGFNGTPSGVTPVADRFGTDSSAYYFDGVNDYIDLPLNDTLKPEFPLTIAFWVKLKVLDALKCRLLVTDFTQNNYHGVWMGVDNDGRVSIAYGGGVGGCNSQNRVAYKTTEVTLDTAIWYHLTGVIYSPTRMALYINCNDAVAAFASGTGPSNVAYSNNVPGSIGRIDALTTPGPVRQYWGDMDELMYWNRSLSMGEVGLLCDSVPLSVVPTWNCVNGLCIDPLDGSGNYNNLLNCQSNCNVSSISDINKQEIIRVVDLLGREIKEKNNTFLIYFYDDGTIEKKIIID
jgi:hypothetical protein